MIAWCLLAAVYVTSISGEIASPTRYVEQSFDVLHYDAFIALDSLPRPVLGESSCTWRLRWRRQPDTIRFHLRSLQVLRVEYVQPDVVIPVEWFVRGQPAEATYHYAVPALASHREGDTVLLRITYRGLMSGEPPRGGYSWGGVQQEGTIVYALGVGFYNNYVSATQHWLACYDHPSDKASYTLRFRVPPSYVVASNGEELPPYDSAEWRIFPFHSSYPAATYLLTFAALPAAAVSVIRDTTSLPLPIVLYARRADSAATLRSFRLVPQMVTTFEHLFGPYPFEKVGYVMTQKGAMEHQTMISFPTALARSGDTINLIAAHELAHQWFGDCVTPLDFRDAWFNESFATLSESLWREKLGGYPAYLDEQQRKINRYLNQYAKPGNPLFEGILTMYDFDRTPPSSNYPHVIYEKGAAVLGMLRYLIGDSSFFGWCRNVMERYRYGNITIDTVEHTLARISGQGDMIRRFVNEWIRGKGWAVLTIEALRMPSAYGWKAMIRIHQTQHDSLGLYTTLPLELSFIGRDTLHRVVIVTSADHVVELDSLNDFTAISINAGVNVRSLALLSTVPTVTSIEVPSHNEQLSVYPSPANDVVWIVAGQTPTEPLMVADATGKIVRTIPAASPTMVFSTAELATGIYYIIAPNGRHRNVASFVVVR